MDETDAIIVDGVFYRVPSLDILKGVHLKVPAGSVCGLFGHNGSGKTTLLKVASGQIQPDSGLTIIDGDRFHEQSKRRRFEKLAYLPQDSMLPPDVTVQTLLTSADLAPTAVPDRLQSCLNQQVRTLSGGERRLLEVEIVLGLDRDYVLLDEPFTGVEPLLIDTISQKIEAAAAQGAGILVTDHYHQYVTPLTDVAYVMRQKQCYRLDEAEPIPKQLKELGYL